MLEFISVAIVSVALPLAACSGQDKSSLSKDNGIESAPTASDSKPKENENALTDGLSPLIPDVVLASDGVFKFNGDSFERIH